MQIIINGLNNIIKGWNIFRVLLLTVTTIILIPIGLIVFGTLFLNL